MRLIRPSFTILNENELGYDLLQRIEQVGRTCYKSESGKDTSYKFVSNLIKRGHESVLEHFSIGVKFIVDRAMSHELVRHRHTAISQESSRYCSYNQDRFDNQITFTYFSDYLDKSLRDEVKAHLESVDVLYKKLKDKGVPNDFARRILPLGTKTELVITANLREWRHILSIRTNKDVDKMLRPLMLDLLETFKRLQPVIFDDIYDKQMIWGD